MIRALCPYRKQPGSLDCATHPWFFCNDLPTFSLSAAWFDDIVRLGKSEVATIAEGLAMRLTIEIVAAAILVFCISATSAAFAAGKMGRSADGLSCSFSKPANASPTARCAAIRRQCGGKFYANYCGDKLLSAM
jgi:hypothetical protein